MSKKIKRNILIPIGIFILCIFLTAIFTLKINHVQKKQYHKEVEQTLNNTISSVREHILYYEEFLESSYPLLLLTDSLTIEQRSEFIKNNIIKDFRSSIQEMGVILYAPDNNRKQKKGTGALPDPFSDTSAINQTLKIMFLESFNDKNEISFKEILNNPLIIKALKMSKESDRISLAWENTVKNMDKENINSSVFLFYPFFTVGKDASADKSDKIFKGWGFLSFKIGDIIEPLTGRMLYTELSIRIINSTGEFSDSLLYMKINPIRYQNSSVLSEISVPLNIADQKLIFHFKNLQNPELIFFLKPFFIFITGFLVSVIIFLLSFLLQKTRNKAEEESAYLSTRLSENEKLREIIFDTANAGIIFLDRDKKILLTNKWWTSKTGFSAEDLSGKKNEEIIFPEDRELCTSLLEDLFSEKNQSKEIKIRYLKKDNSIFWGDLSLSVARILDSNEIMVIGVVIDITEHVEAKEIINLKNAELLRIVEERNRFISTLAHDLRSPFNTMLGFSEILIDNLKFGEYEKIRKNISILNYSIIKTYDLLMDIVSWAKLQTGKLTFNPKTIDLFTLCSDTISIFSPYAACKKIDILLSVTPGKLVTGDADMIKSVIRNLLSNALKFTNSDGCVTISSFDSGMIENNLPETVKKKLSVNSPVEIISIMDTGIGIEPEKLINLFDKSSDFPKRGTEDEKGTGIGLILCREYINKHDGIIWAESIPGKGSTFYFTLQKKN